MDDVRIAGEEKDGSQSAFDQVEACSRASIGRDRHTVQALDNAIQHRHVLTAVSRPILPGRELIGGVEVSAPARFLSTCRRKDSSQPITAERSPREGVIAK